MIVFGKEIAKEEKSIFMKTINIVVLWYVKRKWHCQNLVLVFALDTACDLVKILYTISEMPIIRKHHLVKEFNS